MLPVEQSEVLEYLLGFYLVFERTHCASFTLCRETWSCKELPGLRGRDEHVCDGMRFLTLDHVLTSSLLCFPTEIVDGNIKMTLGMIWTIILRFAIQDISVEGAAQCDLSDGRLKLLLLYSLGELNSQRRSF